MGMIGNHSEGVADFTRGFPRLLRLLPCWDATLELELSRSEIRNVTRCLNLLRIVFGLYPLKGNILGDPLRLQKTQIGIHVVYRALPLPLLR